MKASLFAVIAFLLFHSSLSGSVIEVIEMCEQGDWAKAVPRLVQAQSAGGMYGSAYLLHIKAKNLAPLENIIIDDVTQMHPTARQLSEDSLKASLLYEHYLKDPSKLKKLLNELANLAAVGNPRAIAIVAKELEKDKALVNSFGTAIKKKWLKGGIAEFIQLQKTPIEFFNCVDPTILFAVKSDQLEKEEKESIDRFKRTSKNHPDKIGGIAFQVYKQYPSQVFGCIWR